MTKGTPCFTHYPDLTDEIIDMLVDEKSLIQRDKSGKIVRVFFYENRTNPVYQPQYWDVYFDLIKNFATLVTKS